MPVTLLINVPTVVVTSGAGNEKTRKIQFIEKQ